MSQSVLDQIKIEFIEFPDFSEYEAHCPACNGWHYGQSPRQVQSRMVECLARRREHYERTGEVWALEIPWQGEPVAPTGDIGPDDCGLVAGVDY